MVRYRISRRDFVCYGIALGGGVVSGCADLTADPQSDGESQGAPPDTWPEFIVVRDEE